MKLEPEMVQERDVTNITARIVAKTVPFTAWSDAPHIALPRVKCVHGSQFGAEVQGVNRFPESNCELLIH